MSLPPPIPGPSSTAGPSAGAALAGPTPSLSGLPPTPVPLEQLMQIQRRIQALVASIAQMGQEVAVVGRVDW